MESSPLRPIAEAEIAAYETDGGVCLRGMVDASWLTRLADGAEQALRDHGPHHYIQSAAGDAGFFYTEYFLWRRLAPFRDFAMHSPGGEIAARLTRSAQVHFFMDGLFVKEPKTERPSAWHQDQVYYPIDGRKVVIMWFPLDPVSADTALRDLGNIDHRALLPTIAAPALVVAGTNDAIVPIGISRVAAELLPNATFAEFESSGHAPFIEEGERYRTELVGFLGAL